MIQPWKTSCFFIILVSALSFGSAASGFTPRTSIRIGKIVPLEGLVVVRRKTEGITVEPPAMIIYRGDEVLTNEAGKARILLTGGNEVFVGPSSTLYLNKHFQDRYKYTYNLRLKGKLRAKVQRVRGRRFRVKTSTAVIDVKGTDFIIDSHTKTTQVATFKGLVQLTSLKTKQTVDIPPGRMSAVTKVGKVEKTRKVEIEVVKTLENTGKTGIKELDKIMEPPPPLDPSIRIEIETEPLPIPEPVPEREAEAESRQKPVEVAVREQQAPPVSEGNGENRDVRQPEAEEVAEPEEIPSFWYYAEEYRKRNRLGIGFGIEAGNYSGSYLFLEYNLTPRSQLHLQFIHNSESTGLDTDSYTDTSMQRELTALSYRYFMVDSGLYLGLGLGSGTYEKSYQLNPGATTLSADGSIAMAELGAQAYGSAFNTTFYMSVGMQYLVAVGLNEKYDENTVPVEVDEDFKKQTESNLSVMMIGFGWFF